MTRLRSAAFWISVAAGIVVLGGCEQPTPQQAAQAKADKPFYGTEVYHDDLRAVTCWQYGSGHQGGLSCLPDWMLSKHQGIPVQGGAQ